MKEVCIHGIDLDIVCNECSPPFVLPDYNPLSIDEDFYIIPKEVKPREFSQEQEEEDIAYLKKNLFKSLKVPKEFLKENEE